jgi:hypothetical protein
LLTGHGVPTTEHVGRGHSWPSDTQAHPHTRMTNPSQIEPSEFQEPRCGCRLPLKRSPKPCLVHRQSCPNGSSLDRPIAD